MSVFSVCIVCVQAAHVGIGISGVEGLQASCASDYSIAQVNILLVDRIISTRLCYADH